MVGQDVVRFHVAVQNAQRMQVLEALENLHRKELDDGFLKLAETDVRVCGHVESAFHSYLAMRSHNPSNRTTRHVFEEDRQVVDRLFHACAAGQSQLCEACSSL